MANLSAEIYNNNNEGIFYGGSWGNGASNTRKVMLLLLLALSFYSGAIIYDVMLKYWVCYELDMIKWTKLSWIIMTHKKSGFN